MKKTISVCLPEQMFLKLKHICFIHKRKISDMIRWLIDTEQEKILKSKSAIAKINFSNPTTQPKETSRNE